MAFGADTTTDEVLAGIDLKGKQALRRVGNRLIPARVAVRV